MCLFVDNNIRNVIAPMSKMRPQILFRKQETKVIIVYQSSETNVMNFLFNLLRTKALYMFRALLAHPQKALHKLHLVYCARVMSVGCYQG
jgi:hypothetical protein